MAKSAVPRPAEVLEEGMRLAAELDQSRGTHLLGELPPIEDPYDAAVNVPLETATPPAGTVPYGEAPAEQPPVIETPPGPARDGQGRFIAAAADVPEQPPTPSLEVPPAPSLEVPPAPDHTVAATPPDPWAEYEEVEYDDPDSGNKYTVRARKEDATAVKRGYARQSDYTRKTMTLADAKRSLEPLISSGQIAGVLPLIDRAMNDPEFAEFVGNAYQRRTLGQPDWRGIVTSTGAQTPPQQQQFTPPGGVPYQGQPQQQAEQFTPYTVESDPYLSQALSPLARQLQEQQRTTAALQAQFAQQNQQREAQEAYNRQQALTMRDAHQTLHQQYPEVFTGDLARDRDALTRTYEYAERAGYIQRYGLSVPVMLNSYHAMQQEQAAQAQARAAATQSTAVRSIEAAQAQRVAQMNAAAVAPAAPATNTTKPPPPPGPPPTRTPDGKQVPIKEHAAALIRQIRATQRSAQ